MQGQRYRQTCQLNKRQVSACCQAARLSEELGRPLNLYVVLDFRQTAVSVRSVSHVFERLRSGHFVRWLARKSVGSPPTFIWTIEAAGISAHVNWLVHVPTTLQVEFKSKVQKWFKKITAEEHTPYGAIHVDDVGARATRSTGLMSLVRYICKGIDPHHAARMYIDHVPQGTIVGKRSGVSRSLGKAAIKRRRAAGFPKPANRWVPPAATPPRTEAMQSSQFLRQARRLAACGNLPPSGQDSSASLETRRPHSAEPPATRQEA